MRKLIPALAISLIASTAEAAEFTVTSPDFTPDTPIDNVHVYKGFGCEGENRSPELSWSGAPEGTKSYAVTIYDPDAPTGSGWWHWIVYNIPAKATGLNVGASAINLPWGALQARNDFGTFDYGGPCPPEGDEPHRYIVSVHALDVEKIDLAPGTPAAQIGYHIYAHTLAKAQLTAKYGR